MSNQQSQQAYTVTTKFFQAYGGAIDQEATAYVNTYAKEHNARLLNMLPGNTSGQFVFLWAAK